jgi:hypothetical protein
MVIEIALGIVLGFFFLLLLLVFAGQIAEFVVGTIQLVLCLLAIATIIAAAYFTDYLSTAFHGEFLNFSIFLTGAALVVAIYLFLTEDRRAAAKIRQHRKILGYNDFHLSNNLRVTEEMQAHQKSLEYDDSDSKPYSLAVSLEQQLRKATQFREAQKAYLSTQSQAQPTLKPVGKAMSCEKPKEFSTAYLSTLTTTKSVLKNASGGFNINFIDENSKTVTLTLSKTTVETLIIELKQALSG